MTNDKASPHPWRLVEVWGDTVDRRHLGWAIVIGIAISLSAFLVANRVLAATVSRPELARAYAMLVGLVGCVLAGVVCGLVFKPKRVVVEGAAVDPHWRQEVLDQLAETHGGLGRVVDLPESAVREMKALEIYELFDMYRPTARDGVTGTGSHQ